MVILKMVCENLIFIECLLLYIAEGQSGGVGQAGTSTSFDADMLSHFSGASNALQGADPGAGGEVSNSSNQVLYDQGTVQKCYMLLKIK